MRPQTHKGMQGSYVKNGALPFNCNRRIPPAAPKTVQSFHPVSTSIAPFCAWGWIGCGELGFHAFALVYSSSMLTLRFGFGFGAGPPMLVGSCKPATDAATAHPVRQSNQWLSTAFGRLIHL